MTEQIFPTKGNLIKARKDLALSRLGYELMDRKRNILIRELMQLVDSANEIRLSIEKTYEDAYRALQEANVQLEIMSTAADAINPKDVLPFVDMTKIKKDKDGNLLPDAERLNGYGRFLRKTSLDELGELVNIVKGDMAIVGPRPLLVEYLPLYNEYQSRRHEVRPGLTGLAQVNGRNAVSWEIRFEYDVKYVDDITFVGDMKIIFRTVIKVLKHDGISSSTSATMEAFTGNKEKEFSLHE